MTPGAAVVAVCLTTQESGIIADDAVARWP